MKKLVKFIFSTCRFFIIFSIWSVGYSYWFQRLMIAGWSFNPFNGSHWIWIRNQWVSGWTISKVNEWLFVLTLFAVVPVFLTGLIILLQVHWLAWVKRILMIPVNIIKKKIKKHQDEKPKAKPKVTKRKSYKKTRPAPIRAGTGKIKPLDKKPEEEKPTEQHHHTEKAPQPVSSAPAPTRTANVASANSIAGFLQNAGYHVVENAKIAGKLVDYVAICANHLLVCLVDNESGDWLADEERFNDEEPLWFSESNHRISPVRNVLTASSALLPLLTGSARGMEIKTMVIIKAGTIINAEDMFDVWKNLHVSVCRYENGGPDEITELKAALTSVSAPDDGLINDVSKIVR